MKKKLAIVLVLCLLIQSFGLVAFADGEPEAPADQATESVDVPQVTEEVVQPAPEPPKQEEPAPTKDEPAPKQEEPAPKQEEPAPKQEEPAPKQEEPAPKQEEEQPKVGTPDTDDEDNTAKDDEEKVVTPVDPDTLPKENEDDKDDEGKDQKPAAKEQQDGAAADEPQKTDPDQENTDDQNDGDEGEKTGFLPHLVMVKAGNSVFDGASCYRRQAHELKEDAVVFAVEEIDGEKGLVWKVVYAQADAMETGYILASDAKDADSSDYQQQGANATVEYDGVYLPNVEFKVVADEANEPAGDALPEDGKKEESDGEEMGEDALTGEDGEESDGEETGEDALAGEDGEESDGEETGEDTLTGEDGEEGELAEETGDDAEETLEGENAEEDGVTEAISAEELEGLTAKTADTQDSDFVITSAGMITEYTGTDTDILIQPKINGITVTAIAEGAFARNGNITSMLLHQATSLTSIEQGAFLNCSALKSVSLPNSITAINEDVFKGCSSLSAISWPDSLTDIKAHAFEGCSSLPAAALPATVTAIGDYAFASCTSLSKLVLDDSTAVKIGANAFSGCSGLKGIYLPDASTDIGKSAFENCTGATELSLPSSIKEIRNYTFQGCTGLQKIIIPSGATQIGTQAFNGCSNVGLVTIPATVANIAASAFNGLKEDAAIFLYPKNVQLGSNALGTNSTIIAYYDTDGHKYAKEHSGTTFIPMETVDFAKQTYKGMLNRTPSDQEILSTVRSLASGSMTGGALIEKLLKSTEYKNRKLSETDEIKALYVAMLGRSADSSGLSGKQKMMDEGLSAFYVANNIAGSQEYKTWCQNHYVTPGKITLTENRDKNPKTTAFVVRCYKELLGRKFDVGGLNNWTGKLLRGESQGASIVGSFIRSAEFNGLGLSNSEQIERLYKAMMGRASDPSGKANWMQVMADGASIDRVAYGFVTSAEFEYLCQTYGIRPGKLTLIQNRDKNLNVTRFIARFYVKALGRSFDVSGLNNWTGKVLSGQMSLKQVAASFIFSAEFRRKNVNNTEFVKVLYRTYMGREYDSGGLTNWVNKLNKGVSRESVANSFAESPEFKKLISSFGL